MLHKISFNNCIIYIIIIIIIIIIALDNTPSGVFRGAIGHGPHLANNFFPPLEKH